ncbi:MAG: hypothetical protein AB1448_11370 [Pseudomonadota bacterium]
MKGFPPKLYALSSQLVRAVLQGCSYDWALDQAKRHSDKEQRKYALLVLPLLKNFLCKTKPVWVRDLEVDPIQVGPGLQLPVKVHSLMRVGDHLEVLIIHFWAKGISVDQKRAAMTIVKDRLSRREELKEAKLRWIDLSAPSSKDERTLEEITWETFPLMDNEELKNITDRLYDGWQLYMLAPEMPRKAKPKSDKRQPDMFGDESGPTP